MPARIVGVLIEVDWFLVHRPTQLQVFRAHKSEFLSSSVTEMCDSYAFVKELEDNVAVLQIFPGIPTSTIRAFLSHVRGVVLESFGAGNIPQREDVFQVIKEACDRGVVIVNITQCTKGSVLAYCKQDLHESSPGFLADSKRRIRSRYAQACSCWCSFRSRYDTRGQRLTTYLNAAATYWNFTLSGCTL